MSESEERDMEPWHELVGLLSFKIYKMQTLRYPLCMTFIPAMITDGRPLPLIQPFV